MSGCTEIVIHDKNSVWEVMIHNTGHVPARFAWRKDCGAWNYAENVSREWWIRFMDVAKIHVDTITHGIETCHCYS
jgi:hypothetical protein